MSKKKTQIFIIKGKNYKKLKDMPLRQKIFPQTIY